MSSLMSEVETRKIVKILTAMGLANPPKVGEDQLVAAYQMVWSDLPADLIADAVRTYSRSGNTFWPQPGVLRTLALQSGAGIPDAEVAWAEVQRALGRYTISEVPPWSSVVLQKAVEAVGWRSICMTDDEGLGTLRAQFRTAYQSMLSTVVGKEDARSVLADSQERRAALAGGDSAPLALPARDGPVAAQKRGVPAAPANDPRPGDAAPESASRRRARLRWEKLHPGKPFPDRPFAFGPTGNRVEDAMSFMLTIPSFRALPEERQRHILDGVRTDVERRLADEAANS